MKLPPPSQIPGLNLTQFNNIGVFRPNVAQHIPKPSTRACRARNLFQLTPYQLSCLPHSFQTRPSSLSPDANWVVSLLHLHTPHNRCGNTFTHLRLNCNSLPHSTHDTDHRSINYPQKVVKINLHSLSLIKISVKFLFPINTNPLLVFSSSLLMKTSCLTLKLVKLNFFASFNADNERKICISNVSKYTSKSSDEPFQ